MKADVPALIKLLTSFQAIERQIYVPEIGRKENDSEHSYNLAMVAWYIIESDGLPLMLDKVLKYALVHDLVEVYADDAFALDDLEVSQKLHKEHAALGRLKKQAHSKEFASVIEQYEKMQDEESKFVYGLDKLIPAFTLIQGKVTTWKDYGITISGWEEKFGPKVRKSKYLEPYLIRLIEMQRQNPDLLA